MDFAINKKGKKKKGKLNLFDAIVYNLKSRKSNLIA